MLDVFFYEAFDEEREALKGLLPPDVRAGFAWQTIQEAGHVAPPARVVSIRTQSQIPAAWAGGMDAILSRSTGYDHLLRFHQTAEAGRVALGYLPCYCVRAVAEHAMILWSALLRKLPLQIDQFKRYHRDGLTGRECRGCTLAVVGVGKIGYEAACIARALGMSVVGVDPVQRHADIRYVAPAEAWPQADVLLCCMNLNAGNRGYFNARVFFACRPGAVFVNVARGEMARLTDLADALESGRLGGAGLDVIEDENAVAVALRGGKPVSAADRATLDRLLRHSNTILTPHNAFNSEESVVEKSRQSVEQVIGFLREGRFVWECGQEANVSP